MKYKIVLFSVLLFCLSQSVSLLAQPASYVYAYLSQDRVGNVQISTVDPGDNTSSILTSFTTPNQQQIIHTVANADGTWIALVPYVVYGETNPTIRLLNTVTLEIRDVMVNLALSSDQYIRLSDPQQFIGWSPDGTKLAFESFHDGSMDVYVYALADDTLTQITDNEGYETRISWSNDGTRLAILHDVCINVDACIADLNIINVSNSTVEVTVPISWEGGSLYEQEICHVKWSPDDSYVAFMQICDGSLYATVKEVYLLDVQQQTLHEVTNYTRETDLPDDSFYMIRAAAYDLIWDDPQTLLIGSSIKTGTATNFTTQTVSYSLTNQTLTPLNTTAMAQEWAVNPVTNQLAYRASTGAYFDQQNSAVKIATYNNNILNEFYTVATGCDLRWSPDGLWLAATNRGLPLESCSDPIQGIQFVSGQNGAVTQHNVASTIFDKPIGWVKHDEISAN